MHNLTVSRSVGILFVSDFFLFFFPFIHVLFIKWWNILALDGVTYPESMCYGIDPNVCVRVSSLTILSPFLTGMTWTEQQFVDTVTYNCERYRIFEMQLSRNEAFVSFDVLPWHIFRKLSVTLHWTWKWRSKPLPNRTLFVIVTSLLRSDDIK